MAKAGSLKLKDMSVWHEGTLADQGATLNDLKFDSLEGSGQFILTVQDYLDIANVVSSRINKQFQIQVEWRPEDKFVPEPWRQWRDAHAQVEALGDEWRFFPPEFRELVIIKAKRKGTVQAPDIYANGR